MGSLSDAGAKLWRAKRSTGGRSWPAASGEARHGARSGETTGKVGIYKYIVLCYPCYPC